MPVTGGAVLAGVAGLAIAGCGSSTSHTVTTTVTSSAAAASSSSASSSTEPAAFSSGGGLTVNQIYKKDGPGVVDIVVTAPASSGSLLGGSSGEQQDEGAGVVYNDKGYILTDQHVVANATSIKVTFEDGRVAAAKLIGTDASTDVGVIKVNVPTSELHPLTFADSSSAQVGDDVVAIGSPFSLPETVTSGIVSQTGRPIQAPNNYQIPGAIQTDAPINPGNSGGPLLNAAGEVLGLNDQIETNNTDSVTGEGSSSGVGFATPGNEDEKVANTIISGQKVQHSYVGVFLSSSEGGARISTTDEDGKPPVAVGSPAAKAGLKPGDLITAVNGTKITSTDAFIATIFHDAPGQTVTLTVNRDGKTMQVKVTLATRPASAPTGG